MLDMSFNYAPVLFGEIKSGIGEPPSKTVQDYLSRANEDDTSIGDIKLREEGRWIRFNEKIVFDHKVCSTIQCHGFYRGNDKCKLTDMDYLRVASFPEDYDYTNENIAYIVSMSVPPIMMKRVVTRLIEKGVFDYKLKGEQLNAKGCC
jgi:DNA (cytosine-5)-methyltransferase 1